MQQTDENLDWAGEKVKLLAATFGKKIESAELVNALARQLLNIVVDNDLVAPFDPSTEPRESAVKRGWRDPVGSVKRGDWLIDTLIEEHMRWPVPLVWRKTWSKYWSPADGKAWQEMAGAE